MKTPKSLEEQFKSSVKSANLNYAVLGLLGLWGFYSGVSKSFQQTEPSSAGIPLGVLAIICAAQGLTRVPRVELMCSWRILVTLFVVYKSIEILTTSPYGIWLGPVLVIFAAWIGSHLWRRTYANPWDQTEISVSEMSRSVASQETGSKT